MERREVVSERTETNQTFQNPDGSLTTEMSTQPVRFKDEGGDWRNIDTTLVERNGVWEPKATSVELSFSDGGSGPFASLERKGGDAVALGWPTTLPEPVADGNSLTYREVIPDGDLVVTALPTGFSHSIVLREAPTNANLEIPVPVDLDGTVMRESAGGGLAITSEDDKAVTAPAPLMWDAQEGATGLPSNTAPVEASIERTAGATELVLTPDAGMLADPETEYPVTIDPTFTQTTPTADTFIVDGGSYTASNTVRNWGSMDTGNGGNGLKARSFLRFPNFDFTNKQVTSAQLQARNVESLACVNGATIPEAIAEDWSQTTLTWANQPTVVYNSAPPQYYLPHGGPAGSSCTAHGWASWNVTSAIQAQANGTRPNYGFRLRAATETTSNSWRRWRTQEGSTAEAGTTYYPQLAISYNALPVATVSNVSPCDEECSSEDMVLLTGDTPVVTARASGGSAAAQRLDFELYAGDASGEDLAASESVAATRDTDAIWSPGALPAGDYSLRVRAWDGTRFGNWSSWWRLNYTPSTDEVFDLEDGDYEAADDSPETSDGEPLEEEAGTLTAQGGAGNSNVHPFTTHGDLVHISSYAPLAASAHGCWKTNDTDLKSAKATVTVEIQFIKGGKWVTVEKKSKSNIKPGCGSANRGHAREQCSDTGARTFRSRVDVDIQGWIDTADKKITKPVSLNCTP